jgi:hypothetical protein
MKKILLILMLLTTTGYAAESWICNEMSSQSGPGWIKACGLSHSLSEHTARRISLYRAYAEAQIICSSSTSCLNHKIDVKPGRTVCEKIGKVYTCRRLITVYVYKELEGEEDSE